MTEAQWDRMLDLWEKHPQWIAVSAVMTSVVLGLFLAVLVVALVRAGRFQPPRVTLIVILGLLATAATLALAVNDKSQAMSGLATTAIGALAGALGAEVAHGQRRGHGDGRSDEHDGARADASDDGRDVDL